MNIAKSFQLLIPNLRLGGRYQVVRRLGVGGFSETFLAKDLQLPGKPYCVIKQLKLRTRNPEGWRVAKRLFNSEAEVLYRLGDHDRIPRLFAHFEESRNFYLVQEFIAGASLRHQLLPGQPWPEARVIALIRDILQVLAYVHGQNVIHRDIKPSNLICRKSDGRTVLIDFGAVKQVSLRPEVEHGQDHPQPSMTISIGTLGYMPIEQANGMPQFNSDIYAVGMIGIEALTGIRSHQFQRNSQTGELIWQGPFQASTPTQTSPELREILDRMVRCHFKERYQTVQEVLEAIDALLSQSSPIDLEAEFAVLAANSTAALSDLPYQKSQPPNPTSGEPALSEPSPSESIPSESIPSKLEADEPIGTTAAPVLGLPLPHVDSTIDPSVQLTVLPENNAVPVTQLEGIPEVDLRPDQLPESTADATSDSGTDWAGDRANNPQPQTSLFSQFVTQHVTQKWVSLQTHARTFIQVLSTQPQPAVDRLQGFPVRSLWLGIGGLTLATAVVAVGVTQLRLYVSGDRSAEESAAKESAEQSQLPALLCREPSPPDLPSGSADLVFTNGTRYYGPLNQGLPADGRGIMVFPSGNRYDGELKSGKRNGCGTYTFANGRRYVGQFQDDAFQGQGMWLLENGDQYIGMFQANRCHGPGTFIFRDGTTKRGNWRNGQMEGTDLSCDR